MSINCTAYTFYGAVGTAVRSGLDSLTIFLRPTLGMVGWWLILRKLVRIGRLQRITLIADLISSRYGKSAGWSGLVTILATVGTAPCIALLLQSIGPIFAAFTGNGTEGRECFAILVTLGLATFPILFGTRTLDVDERHSRIVTAIALEAVVRLVTFVAVGPFVVWGLSAGPAGIFAMIEASPIAGRRIDGLR